MLVDDFLSKWESRTPGREPPKQELLSGVCIKESGKFKYFPEEELSKIPQVLFSSLFYYWCGLVS